MTTHSTAVVPLAFTVAEIEVASDPVTVTAGAPVDAPVAFSAAQGGALCKAHRAGGERLATLTAPDRDALAALLEGRWPDPPLDARHAAAHRRLLMTFIRHHLAEDRPLPALAFWDRESWNATSS